MGLFHVEALKNTKIHPFHLIHHNFCSLQISISDKWLFEQFTLIHWIAAIVLHFQEFWLKCSLRLSSFMICVFIYIWMWQLRIRKQTIYLMNVTWNKQFPCAIISIVIELVTQERQLNNYYYYCWMYNHRSNNVERENKNRFFVRVWKTLFGIHCMTSGYSLYWLVQNEQYNYYGVLSDCWMKTA